MPFSSIAVFVDCDPQARTRVELAYEMARRQNALLIGLGAAKARMPVDPAGFGVTAAALEAIARTAERAVSSAEECFRSVAGPGDDVQWRGAAAAPLDHAILHSRAADLVVVGREHDVGDDSLFLDPGAFILQSGRPVLVVPPGVSDPPLGAPALLAWKDTREARRAVADAMPFLCEASSVSIVGVCGGDERKSEEASLLDVASLLQRHGANIDTVRTVPADGDAAKVLLTLVRQREAELIVMGAYGRSRLAEWVFGGVTRTFLKTTPICCLMSH